MATGVLRTFLDIDLDDGNEDSMHMRPNNEEVKSCWGRIPLLSGWMISKLALRRCVLMQDNKVMAYASRQLKLYECNYSIHDLELIRVRGVTANVVADWRAMFCRMSLFEDGGLLAELQVRPTLVSEIKEKQPLDVSFLPPVKQVEEVHNSPYIMHPRGNKMYRDFRELYWWLDLKREERVTMDFVSGLPLTHTKKDPIWVIGDRLTKLTHFLPKELHEALGARLDSIRLSIRRQIDSQSGLFKFWRTC
ncbi:uncharacterized protein LOC128043019 [Gossypium raimondii]|uniref:uncharacterized protein LOC128043019 n=1 Tax=Gossypium raimondii TaxID=29730 RepID=UPI00227AA21F|nr:uncharacterized protein LOC128043019 [Gossypium raimondii]